MSYIHNITGDVYHDVEVEEARDEFFECDELIAPIISMLIKKGFRTQFCCSGHAYPTIEDYYAKETCKIDLANDRISEIIRRRGDDTITKITKTNIITDDSPFSSNYTIVEHEEMNNVTYIYFDCDMPWDYLPPLPKGWTIDRAPCGDCDVIRYNKPWSGLNLEVDGFEKLEMIFRAMRDLYKWVVSLDYHGTYMAQLVRDAKTNTEPLPEPEIYEEE